MQSDNRADLLMAENIIPFPLPYRGDPEPRRMALASIGFHWRAGMWRRGRVVLSDSDIDAMDSRTWERSLRRWTKRRPRQWL
jgi:hypothetical protein